MLIAAGSVHGRENCKLHFWLRDKDAKKVYATTDVVRSLWLRNGHMKSTGMLARPIREKIAYRLKEAKLSKFSCRGQVVHTSQRFWLGRMRLTVRTPTVERQALPRLSSALLRICSGEFTSPYGGVKPPLRPIEAVTATGFATPERRSGLRRNGG